MHFRSTITLLCLTSPIAPTSLAQSTSRVSVDSAGVQGNGFSAWPSMSADGRYVAYMSDASTLVPGDTNDDLDVFVHDRQTGATSRVSLSSAGLQVDGVSSEPSISADGRFVAFVSSASALVPGDTNLAQDIFVRDRQTGTTARVSVDSMGAQGSGMSIHPSISADGRFVAFTYGAGDFDPSDTNGDPDVYVHDRQTGATTLVSRDTTGTPGNDESLEPSISADGRYVAFVSLASNLVPGDVLFSYDVFVRDRLSGETSLVSKDSAGVFGNDVSRRPSISADGRFVAFHSDADNLVPDDTNGRSDVFIHDRLTGVTERASVDSGGVEGDAGSFRPSISADGRFVAYGSDSTNLVPGDTNAFWDVVVHDRQTGQTCRASVSTAGVQGASDSGRFFPVSVSADGRYVAFDGTAGNLVSGDVAGFTDVFVRELRDPAVCRAGAVNAGAGPIADVLTVNGSTVLVTVAVGEPFRIDLSAAPLGPDPARYFAWVWLGYPANPYDFTASGSTLGCTVNPTPFHRLAAPQAFRCLRGSGMPSAACRGIKELTSPPRAPWALVRNGGFGHRIVLTLQGVLEDAGAGNPVGFSVTNAVTLEIR